MPQKPLLLKDFLELDPFIAESDPTTVRYLLDSELYGKAKLIRSRSTGRLTSKITAVINAFKNFPVSSPTRPRIMSKRFWKKKEAAVVEERGCKVTTVKDIVRLNSFAMYGAGSDRKSTRYCPSPVVSSCSETDTSSSGSSSSNSGIGSSVESVDSHHRQPQEVENQGCHSEEEKEQLSPVSVMDFPYQDDEGEEDEISEATSSNFEQNLANIERTTQQLLQKIRRFESLAELDPVDLEDRFASFEEDESMDHVASSDADQTDEITAWDLIGRLKCDRQLGPHGSMEKLLVDFFMEGLSWSKSTPASSADVDGLLSAASDWMDGGGCLVEEEHGNDQLKEMERNGRWRSFEVGRDDVAADVEFHVLGLLVRELVLDLAVY